MGMDASGLPVLKRTPALLVSAHLDLQVEQVDHARSASEGLALWQERRHLSVLADFGALGNNGMTGVRLARALRADSRTVRTVLLCEAPDASRLSWARANGADEVLERTVRAVSAWLHPAPPAASLASVPEALRARLTRALQVQGRIGPAAALMVDDAIDEWIRQPTTLDKSAAHALVEQLAQHIRHAPARAAFLQCFTKESHHALV
jgi:CheY-like chemotaxis protein